MNALTLTAPSTFTFGETATPEAGAGESAGESGGVRNLWERCARHGRVIRPEDPAGDHGTRGGRGDRGSGGEGVMGWAVGDRVTFDSMLFCGECSGV